MKRISQSITVGLGAGVLLLVLTLGGLAAAQDGVIGQNFSVQLNQ